jgi:hypothetical protein
MEDMSIQKPGTTINEVCEIMMILKEINESLKLQNLRLNFCQ